MSGILGNFTNTINDLQKFMQFVEIQGYMYIFRLKTPPPLGKKGDVLFKIWAKK